VVFATRRCDDGGCLAARGISLALARRRRLRLFRGAMVFVPSGNAGTVVAVFARIVRLRRVAALAETVVAPLFAIGAAAASPTGAGRDDEEEDSFFFFPVLVVDRLVADVSWSRPAPARPRFVIDMRYGSTNDALPW